MENKKEFVTLQEAAAYTGIKRATIYRYLEDLGIKPQKFGRDRHAYISLVEAERLKEYKETPWKVKRQQAELPDDKQVA